MENVQSAGRKSLFFARTAPAASLRQRSGCGDRVRVRQSYSKQRPETPQNATAGGEIRSWRSTLPSSSSLRRRWISTARREFSRSISTRLKLAIKSRDRDSVRGGIRYPGDARDLEYLSKKIRSTPRFPIRVLEELIEYTRAVISRYAPMRNPVVRTEEFKAMQKRIKNL